MHARKLAIYSFFAAGFIAFAVLAYGLYDVNTKQNRLTQNICTGSNASRVQINSEIIGPLRRLLLTASKSRLDRAAEETDAADRREHLRISKQYAREAAGLSSLKLVNCAP